MASLRLAVATAAVIALAGCAPTAQQINAAIQANKDQFTACEIAVLGNPEYSSLLGHNFPAESPPAAELANDTLPTPEQARLLVQRWNERAPCRAALVAAEAAPPINRPDIAQISNAVWAAVGDLNARFSHGQMTWAARAREGMQIMQDGQKALQQHQAQQAR